MRLIRLDGWGPAEGDLYLHPHLTVLVGAPATTAAAVVDAVRALGDPSVVPPVGLVEVDRNVVAIGPQRDAPGPDPILELRAGRRPPPFDHPVDRLPEPGPDRVDDPGATARRVAAERIESLRAELDFVEGELRVAEDLERLAAAAPDPTAAERRPELEAAADQVSLALLQAGPGGHGTELEGRLRALVDAADDAAVLAEAIAWRSEELDAELRRDDPGDDARDAERTMLLAEVEALRSQLLELDVRGAVTPADRERRAEIEARVGVLLGELGYDRYVDLALGVPRSSEATRRDRVLAARRALLRAELERLRAESPGEVDDRTSRLERARLQSEAAGLLGVPLDVVERLTATEVADLIRERSVGTGGDGGLGVALGRLRTALAAVGSLPDSGVDDAVELLAAARSWLAGTDHPAAPGGSSPVDSPGSTVLRRRAAELRDELAVQVRLLDVLVSAADPAGDRLPVGVPLAGRLAGEAAAAHALVHRVAALRAAAGPSPSPLVVFVDDGTSDVGSRLLEVAEQLQCVVVCPAGSPAWRAIGEDAGRVVEW